MVKSNWSTKVSSGLIDTKVSSGLIDWSDNFLNKMLSSKTFPQTTVGLAITISYDCWESSAVITRDSMESSSSDFEKRRPSRPLIDKPHNMSHWSTASILFLFSSSSPPTSLLTHSRIEEENCTTDLKQSPFRVWLLVFCRHTVHSLSNTLSFYSELYSSFCNSMSYIDSTICWW